MIRCSASVARNCHGFTDEVYRIARPFGDPVRPPFGACIECVLAARSLGLALERVHGYAARAIAQTLPPLVIDGIAA